MKEVDRRIMEGEKKFEAQCEAIDREANAKKTEAQERIVASILP